MPSVRPDTRGRIVTALARGDALTVAQLAARVGASPASVHASAAKLVAQGVLERVERGSYRLATPAQEDNTCERGC